MKNRGSTFVITLRSCRRWIEPLGWRECHVDLVQSAMLIAGLGARSEIYSIINLLYADDTQSFSFRDLANSNEINFCTVLGYIRLKVSSVGIYSFYSHSFVSSQAYKS